MANIKISELNPLLTVEDADVLPIVDNGVTKKVTAAILQSYTQGNSVLLTGAQTVAGIKTFTSQLASSVATGTAPFSVASTTKVTNLNADLLDGLSSADFQATLSGTGIVKSTAGTISYLTDNTANWDTAYNDKINSAAVTGSGTNTLTLTQQDAGTITATWVNGTLIREVRNTTGATLTKGTIVYISGATGNKPTVTKAIATGDSTSAQTFGFIQSDLANNANGYVVVVGDLTGVDTSAFAEGAQLYLSSTVAGTFTDVKQYAPAHLVYVGIVTRAHPTLGQIEVNIQNGYELDELHNVAAQNPSNGDILQFVTSTGLWTKVAGTTTNISEGTNLYFTNARSRSAISESVTGLDYNSTTGVLSTTSGYGIPTTASQATWDTAYNDSIVSAAVTGTTTKTLTLNQQDGGTVTASWTDINTDAVSSVFGRTGAVVAASGDYTTTQVTEGTNLYYTEARVNANTNVAANTAARHNAVTLGTANGLSLSTQQLSLGLASGSTTGALSSTDWTTFNNKQNALTNPITGTGTTNYLPKFTGASALGNSLIYDNGTNVGIGTTSPDVFGRGYAGTILGVSSSSQSAIELNSGTGFGAYFDMGVAGTRTLSIYSDTTSSNIYTLGAQALDFGTNSASRLYITSAGNVGVGTTSPAYKFQTSASVNSDWVGSFYNTSTTTPNGLQVRVGVSSTAQALGVYTDGIGYTFNVLGNGNVGIGTTTPQNKLVISNGGAQGLEIGADATYNVNLAAYNRSSPGYIPFQLDASKISFLTGNVLIGTTTDAGYKLDVNGTARVSGMATIVSGIGTGLNFKFSSGYGNSIIGLNYDSGADSGNSMYFGVNNAAGSPVTALTLYGTGAATFSSSVTTGGNILVSRTTAPSSIRLQSASPYAYPGDFTIQSGGYGTPTFVIYDNTAAAERLVINGSGAATFSGQVNIGNPVAAAVAVASTHKVEIVIGGTTYYLLATT